MESNVTLRIPMVVDRVAQMTFILIFQGAKLN